MTEKEKKEKDSEKASRLEMHRSIKEKKELDNLREQIRIKEEYMKTVIFHILCLILREYS